MTGILQEDFIDPQTSARITRVGINLKRKGNIILEPLSTGREVHTRKFEQITEKTSNIYIESYGKFRDAML